MGSLNTTHEEFTLICLLPKQGREGRLKLNGMLACFLQLFQHVLQPEPIAH